MRIVVLRASYEGTSSPTRQLARPFDPTPVLESAGHEVFAADVVGVVVADQLAAIDRELKPDVYLNLCQGGLGEGRSGPYVPDALAAMGRPYTGAHGAFYNLHKVEMKRRIAAAGVDTPASVHVTTEAGIALAAQTLRFPLFVKHHDGNNSISVFRDNLVADEASLYLVARRVIDTYGGAIVEEYVAGSEVAVLLAQNPDDPTDPVVFAPLELGFPEGEQFFHFDLKWGSYAHFTWRPITDASLRARLQASARLAWLACGGRSYARCDFRVDAAGRPWLLEINPNCCVFYPADDFDIADQILIRSELGHRGFVDLVLRSALQSGG